MADRDPSTRGPTRKPASEPVDGLLGPLAATTLLLGVLLLWARTYEQSCVALASPGFVYIAVFWGLLEYRIERRRYAIDYYIDDSSPWRQRLRGHWLPAATSMAAAFPLAAFLAGFAALAHAADWLLLTGAALLAPLLFNRLAVWPGRHFRRDAGGGVLAAPAGVLTSRIAGRVLLGLLVAVYVYFNYWTIAAPANIFPGSPEGTVETFAAQVRSACPVVETGLRAAATFDGAAWWFATSAATAQRTPDGIMMIVWAAFLLNAALAMTGFVRGVEGAILMARRLAPGTRAGGARDGGTSANQKRWMARTRRATIVVLPLVVLVAIGLHALQQRAVERWSVEFRQGDLLETRRSIDESVEAAFTPAYAALPQLADRHYSAAGWFHSMTSFIGEDKTLLAELRRMISRAREAAAERVSRELREKSVAELVRLFSRDVKATPSWLRQAYGWVLEPVLHQANSRLAEAVVQDPREILREVEQEIGAMDFTTRAAAYLHWLGATINDSGRDKEVLRQWMTAVMNEEKERTKAELSRAVEAVVFTPLGDFAPARLRPARQ